MTKEVNDLFEKAVASAVPRATTTKPAWKLSDIAKGIDPGPEPQTTGEADELMLYADNDQTTYRQKMAIVANMKRKILKGTPEFPLRKYSHAMAPAGWLHLADTASQRYMREIGREGIDPPHRGTGGHAYAIAVRREAAKYWAWQFIKDAQSGEYND